MMVYRIMLRRKIYSELLKWKNEPFKEVLVVKGARQVGKSFIIEQFIKENFERHLTIDFVENPDLCHMFDGNLDVDAILTEISVRFPGFSAVPGKTAIFLDEIQMCPEARTALKSFVKDGRFRVIASGSLMGLNYKVPRSNPVGYERSIEMYSLDFEEFLWALGLGQEITERIKGNIASMTPYDRPILDDLSRYYSIFTIVGGMPEAVSKYLDTRDIQEVRKVQGKIVDGYREDISKYADPKDKDKIIACFDSIPLQLSKESKKFSYKFIDSEFVPTYRTYESSINWMKDAAMIEMCCNVSAPSEPLEEHVIDSQFKIYMRDTGLLVYMLGLNAAKSILSGDTRVNRGAIAENAVAEGIRKNGFRLRYFKADALEIDFIAVLGSIVTAIDVKSGNNRQAKSLRSVKDKYRVRRRMKFEKTNIYKDDEGVEHYPLFACAFMEEMAPRPQVDLSIDTSEFLKRFA